jgi:hypothetical protein
MERLSPSSQNSEPPKNNKKDTAFNGNFPISRFHQNVESATGKMLIRGSIALSTVGAVTNQESICKVGAAWLLVNLGWHFVDSLKKRMDEFNINK